MVLALGICGWSDLRLCLSGLASVGRAQNFRAHEKIFSYAQKFPHVRTPIFRFPHGEFFACARAEIFAYTEIFFRIYRNFPPHIGRIFSVSKGVRPALSIVIGRGARLYGDRRGAYRSSGVLG